jgi:uncharacterized membrane protein YeaQ/YmgE (transglycosylase-associated protein family)
MKSWNKIQGFIFYILTHFLYDFDCILISTHYSITMNILLWTGLGLIAGGFASRYLDDSLEYTLLDIVLGVVGAFMAGYLMYNLGNTINGINLFQLFTTFLSACTLIWIGKSIRRLH